MHNLRKQKKCNYVIKLRKKAIQTYIGEGGKAISDF